MKKGYILVAPNGTSYPVEEFCVISSIGHDGIDRKQIHLLGKDGENLGIVAPGFSLIRVGNDKGSIFSQEIESALDYWNQRLRVSTHNKDVQTECKMVIGILNGIKRRTEERFSGE